MVIRPSSRRKTAWDLLSVLLMGYDVLMIPMSAFVLPHSVIRGAMDMAITIFWTLDVILMFSAGFYNQGVIEMRRSHIALRYLKTWFALDIVVVGVDWVVILFG